MRTQVDRFRCMTITILIVLMIVFVATACRPTATPQPTIDPATPAAALKMTEDKMRLQAHQTSTAEKAAFSQQQTFAAQTLTAQATPTSPPTATTTPYPSRTPDVRPTQQYEAMKAKVEQYNKDGYLPSVEGNYHRLGDYEDSWAQLEWYRWYETGYQPGSFAVESDIEWDSASTTANWFDSGCGYVFHIDKAENSHYLIYLGLDGYVYSSAYYKGYYQNMGHAYFGKLDVPRGKAHIALVVNRDHYVFYVNDKLVLKVTGFQNQLLAGPLAFTVNSGTNKGFGTSCKFTNTDLWTIQE